MLQVERGSWLRRREYRVTAAGLALLKQRVAYTSSTNGGPIVSHPRLELQAGAHTKPLVLTPALAGPEAAQWLQAPLRQALGVRVGARPRARTQPRTQASVSSSASAVFSIMKSISASVMTSGGENAITSPPSTRRISPCACARLTK